MNLIAAVDKNWGIGKDGKLLFSIKRDMEFFKRMTLNKIVVMGRKTFDTLKIKPLPHRMNIVLTRDRRFKAEGVIVYHSVEEILNIVKDKKDVFIIGGEKIYKAFLPYCDKAYITKIFAEREADSYMVNLDNEQEWKIASETKDFTNGEFAYRFAVYERIKNSAFL